MYNRGLGVFSGNYIRNNMFQHTNSLINDQSTERSSDSRSFISPFESTFGTRLRFWVHETRTLKGEKKRGSGVNDP